MVPKHAKHNNYAAGNRFARNGIIFTIIIFIIILIGYFYHHFVTTTVPPASQVPSQPVETLTQPSTSPTTR